MIWVTSSWAKFGFMGVNIKSKEFTILKIFLIFCMQIRAKKMKWAIIEIGTSLNFIADGMI